MKGEELSEDDPQMSYMISACARICKILGAGFEPYLPLVMGPVMKTASIKPEVVLLDNEELTGVEENTEDWQFMQLGEQQNFGIKTAGLHGGQGHCLPDVGLLRQGAQGTICCQHRAGGLVDGPHAEVLLP